jgi:hypothetical protein
LERGIILQNRTGAKERVGVKAGESRNRRWGCFKSRTRNVSRNKRRSSKCINIKESVRADAKAEMEQDSEKEQR